MGRAYLRSGIVAAALLAVCAAVGAGVVTPSLASQPTTTTAPTLAPPSGSAGVSLTASPWSAHVLPGNTQAFTALVINASDTLVTWGVNGIAGGNSSVGQICAVSQVPCQPVTNGTAAPVDHLAPGATPSPNPVTVQATSAADATKTASPRISVSHHVVVKVQPAGAALAPLACRDLRRR
jgi:hypothetical protein